MIRFLLILLTGITGSLFLFPVNLPFAPTVNSKMVLAAFGAVVFFLERAQHKAPSISKDFLVLCIICVIISIWAFFCTVINHTTDYAFATYIISVVVWLGAAYTFTWMIRKVHGKLDVQIIGDYLIGICVAQCIVAYAMNLYPGFKQTVNHIMGFRGGYLDSLRGRLYGIGAALDPAGLRFSGALVINAYSILHIDFSNHRIKGALLILSFIIISVFGNMIARTTSIGMLIGIALLLIVPLADSKEAKYGAIWGTAVPLLAAVTILGIWFYNSSGLFRTDFRFGFEGFFSLVEKGRWEVHSNEILKGMIVWPEQLKTWIVGDGFFDSPRDIPNRMGQVYGGFYMRTDIGYLRYIFYFGVIGLVGMIAAFTQMTATCIKGIDKSTLLFTSLLLVNLIGWLKVSSDIVMVFAPFLVLSYMRSEELT